MRCHPMPTSTSLALAATALAFAPPLPAQEAEPFRTRNLSPLVTIFAAPGWRSSVREPGLVLTSELANHYRLSRRHDDLLILDGETWRNGVELEAPLGERWLVTAELSHYRLSGGVLDDVVDAWHSAFSMPDGGRNNRPEDALLFQIADAGGVFYELDRRADGLGDLRLGLGRRLGSDGRFLLTAAAELPTGDEEILAGNGATDWAVTLLAAGERELAGRPAGGFWGLGVVAAGDADAIEFRQNDLVPVAVVGGGWRLLPRIGFRVQVDVHGPFYDTPLEELGQTAVQATLGGWAELGERSRIDFAVNEDLHVSTSPDVVIHASLHWRW